MRTGAKILLVLGVFNGLATASGLQELASDRSAIERVYHDRRTGTKPSFEEALPADVVLNLVKNDQLKERALSHVYAISVGQEMVDAEVARIEATTRAPEVLAELKRALGNDPVRFARSVARPIVVDKLLRQRFENDDKLHAAERAISEAARKRLLNAEAVEGMVDSTWSLEPRPADQAPAASVADAPPSNAKSESSNYSNEATAQVAKPMGGGPQSEMKLYFSDLDPGLQGVLRAQLRQTGDVSAVIETPQAFLLFIAKDVSESSLSASCLTVYKRSLEAWLASLPE